MLKLNYNLADFLKGNGKMDLNIEKNRLRKEEIYNEFIKNKRISEEIYSRNKKIKMLNAQIKALQEKAKDLAFELDILQSIKDSQKTLIDVEQKVERYIASLNEKKELNVWTDTFTSNTGSHVSSVLSIKNATYSGTIILNQNEEKNFYRVDFNLILSPLLLNLAKEHKHIFQNIFEIKMVSEGKVLFSKESSDEYVKTIKEKYKTFFVESKSPLLEEFKDVNSSNSKYKAYDFIKYDDSILDGFSIIEDNINNENNEEIPF